MKKLILVRHSDAESGSFSSTDFERKLTTLGKNKTIIQANQLKKRNITPDLIVTSSAMRAAQTADILLDILNPNCPIKKIPFLYEDYTTDDFIDFLTKIDVNVETLFVVGHNPNISAMASKLDLYCHLNFHPCSIGIFEIEDKWEYLEVGGGNLVEYF